MLSFRQKYWKFVLPLLAAVFCLVEADGKGDFYIFLSAADDLSSHANIFEKKYVDGYHYFYSVFFALLLKPFSSLPFFWLKFSWIYLNALLFFDLLRMLYKSGAVQQLDGNKKDWFVFLVFVASLRFFTNNIHTSQITVLILWCSIRGLTWIFSGKIFAGALILALGINIKLLPVVFLPYLLWRGQFKAFFFTMGFYLLLMFLPSLFIGHQYNMNLISTWLSLVNPNQQAHILDVDERSFHGLSTLLSTLLVEKVPDQFALPLKRNIADISLAVLAKVILIVRVVLAVFTLYFLRSKIFSAAKSNLQQFFEVAYILLVIPLIFPHQQHYAFLFAMPAFAACLYFLMRDDNKHRVLSGILILIYLVFNLRLLLGEFNKYYEHYKIITWAALLLIVLLAIVFKKAKEKNYFSPGSRVTLP